MILTNLHNNRFVNILLFKEIESLVALRVHVIPIIIMLPALLMLPLLDELYPDAPPKAVDPEAEAVVEAAVVSSAAFFCALYMSLRCCRRC
jgi:hypothetical protein